MKEAERKIEKLVEESFIFLEEMRAIDRRKEALKMGIIPAAGTNWNAARKNPKLLSKLRTINTNARVVQKNIVDSGIKPTREIGGIILNNDKDKLIRPLGIGTTTSVYTSAGKIAPPNTSTIHTHPYVIPRYNADNKSIRSGNTIKNPNDFRILTFPKTLPSEGDLKGMVQNLNRRFKSNSRTDYIAAPLQDFGEISQTRTYTKKDSNQPIHKTTIMFGGNPRDTKHYYDLNGRYQRKGYGFNPKTREDNYPQVIDTIFKPKINPKKYFDPSQPEFAAAKQHSLLDAIKDKNNNGLKKMSGLLLKGKLPDQQWAERIQTVKRKGTIAMGKDGKIYIV